MNYKDRLKRYNEDRKRRNRRASGSGAAAPDLYLTDPANPASVFYTSESSDSGYASRSEPERPSYDYGSSSSYDSGSSSGGGSYGE